MIKTKTKIKIYLPLVGFSLAGWLWGLEIWRNQGGDPIGNPFSYVLGALFFGLLGGLSLWGFFDQKKKFFKFLGLGILGWIIAWFLPLAIDYWLFLFGNKIFILIDLFGLKVSEIGLVWLEFLAMGMIIGLIYSLILQRKKWPMIWKTGLGFALASFIAPIFSNIFIVFAIIGMIFGLSILWSLRKF